MAVNNTPYEGYGTCPVCNGTGHNPVTAEDWQWPQYQRQGWKECRNCGGQTMSSRGLGFTPKRQPTDEMGCLHEMVGTERGRCYTVYHCKHCNFRFDIDSGD